MIKKMIDFAKKLLGKAKKGAKNIKDRIVQWWKAKKGFKDEAGK